MLPGTLAQRRGEGRYQDEPHVCVSTIVGPGGRSFGRGGISWLSGTAAWLYVAATQYLLGVRPELDGLRLLPCLPRSLAGITRTRHSAADLNSKSSSTVRQP